MLYLKNSIKQYDLSAANTLNDRVVKNAAIFSGHNVGRSISATGTLRISVKTSTDIQREIPGGRITITNRQALKNKTNGLEYSLNIGAERMTYLITSNSQFFVPIIQGRWERRFFTGTGNENQTYQVTIRGQKDVENFNYEILVNGEIFSIKKHIYDMLPNEKSCVVKSSFDGGIDVIFGNTGFGMIPTIGSIIEVNYLVTDGANGSIFRRTSNDFTFLEPALDGFGNTIDIGNLFDVSIYTDINFGANRESTQFTRNLLPIVSNNFVLGLPQQYAYQIKRLGVFSHVNAYERFGTIYIVATPNIKLFKNQNADYFSISVRAFELDSYERSKIDQYLRTNGNIMLSRRYQITSPVLSYYIMNVFIITYTDAIDESVNSQIRNVVSEYFLNFTRLDRVPKSDLVAQLSTIHEIHSVDVSFVSKKNEDYHRVELQRQENIRNKFAALSSVKIRKENPNYDPQSTLGLDPVLGDIIFEPSEIPIIRGGWYDRNTIFYSADIEEAGLKSINIIKKGTISSSNRSQI
ncbi:hypothetical protein EBU71_15125 [bacterium]|nr:hypothetical protein [Candidatus Elulimicrobium humile]